MILQKILRFAEEDLARVEAEIRQELHSEVDQIGEIGSRPASVSGPIP